MSRPAQGPRRSGAPFASSSSRRPGAGSRSRRPRTDSPTLRVDDRPSELERAFAASLASAPAQPAGFDELGLPAPLLDVLRRRGIDTPFPIQARTLPDALAGRDLLGRAETGSGKTLAFGLPMLARLAPDGRRPHRVPRTPRGLVLVPTRELAGQVQAALAPLAAALDLDVAAVYGGAPMRRQIDGLRRGVDLLVATPGRLQDLIEQGECTLSGVRMTALDEADHMADLGFLPAVTRLLDMTPPDGQRMMFSATLDRGVDKLVRAYLTDPAVHAVASAAAPVTGMDHLAFTVAAEEKIAVATRIAGRPGRTLLFVRTKHGADRLAKQLRREGVEAGALHGNLAQNARQRALDAFTSGRARVLVATDVAARGIHVDDVDLVVHFDPPADHKDYLHRSGRTARAGATGTVLSLLLPEQVREAGRVHARAGVRASAATVGPNDAVVLELASSGAVIVPAPEPVQAAEPRRAGRSGGGPRSGRRPRSGPYRSRSGGSAHAAG